MEEDAAFPTQRVNREDIIIIIIIRTTTTTTATATATTTTTATTIIIITIDSIYIAQICNTTQAQCASTHHSIIYPHIMIIYTRHTHSMINLDLCKSLPKEVSVKLGFEIGQGGDISQTGRQQIPDRWSNETEWALTNRFEIVEENAAFPTVRFKMSSGALCMNRDN